MLRTCEGVVGNVLPADMEQCSSEVVESHLHGIIQAPKCGHEGITKPGESATRCCISFEHVEGVVVGLYIGRYVGVLGDDICCATMRKVLWDQCLRVQNRVVAAGELGAAVGERITFAKINTYHTINRTKRL